MRSGGPARLLAGVRRWTGGLLLLIGAACPAAGHGQRAASGGSFDGVAIPMLSHGQMSVIAAYRPAILDLAAQQMPTDPVMRRLEGYINLQYFACAWGVVPGSVTDEASPFNECSHAYLAAARALLIHLQGMPGDRTMVRALSTAVERAMLENGASLILCRYSDETFNTAEIISPRWRDIPFDPASLATAAGLILAAAASGWMVVRWMGHPAGQGPLEPRPSLRVP